MTVETTSFLASSKIASNGSEKSAKILKSNKNLVIFLLAAILLIFCLSASILQIWIFHRMNGMQKEIDQLRINIRDMENNEVEDRELLKEISEFNRKYYMNHNQNEIKNDMDMDENINLPVDKIKFDDVGEEDDGDDDDGEYSEEHEDENFNGYHSGYGDDYDAEEEYDDSNEEEINDSPKVEEENNIYKDMEKHTRQARSIAGVTNQGVPIVDEPYTRRRNRTKFPNDVNDPKLKLTWNGHSRSNSRREHVVRNRHHNHNVRHQHNGFAFAAAPVHHTFESVGQRFNGTPTSTYQTPSIQSRQSRVMHFEDKTEAFRQVVGKDQLAKLQEQRLPPEHYVHNSAAMIARRPMRKNLELRNAKRMKITAVHFDGDSSKLEETSHYSYKGNKKVELNKDQYMHWKPAEWVYSHGMAKYFQMDSSGTLTVNDHGLFLIYAQVLYHDSHDLNGYIIEHNGDEHYKCITMTHTGTRGEKTNSCYTSGLIHLRNGDKIRLRDLANHRNVLMDKAKSYFGLVKINLIPSVSSAESSEIVVK